MAGSSRHWCRAWGPGSAHVWSQIARTPSHACRSLCCSRDRRHAATPLWAPSPIDRIAWDPAAAAVMLSVAMVSYPRRQQLRRLMRATRFAAVPRSRRRRACCWRAPATIGLAAHRRGARGRTRALESSDDAPGPAQSGRRRVRGAGPASVEPLAREGWHVAHAVDWPGRGDLDHVLCSPSGMGFVIETKTLRYSSAHLARTVDSARWLARRRWRYPAGVCPIVCVTRARRVEQIEEDVLVVSLDRLLLALRRTRPLRRRAWSTRRSHERETADQRAAPRG